MFPRQFREGFVDILPVLAAVAPIGFLWGTLAGGKGLSPVETGGMSAAVFAGAAQFIALDQWSEPVPWATIIVTTFVVNFRYVLMGASLSRHLGQVPRGWRALCMFLMADEVWAYAERRARKQPLVLSYYMGIGVPMFVVWVSSTFVGAVIGQSIGDPAIYGFDFAFSATFIGIIAGFWRGARTGLIIAASAFAAVLVKLILPGAWFIVAGGLAGSLVAALLPDKEEQS